MATLTMVGTIAANGRISVAKSTGGALGGGVAALLIDNTLTKHQIDRVIRGLERAWRRESSRRIKPAQVPTTGTSVE